MTLELTGRDMRMLRSLMEYREEFALTARNKPVHFCAAVSNKVVVIARNLWGKTTGNAEARRFYPYVDQLHAEFLACKHFEYSIDSVYVLRMNREGELRNSKPCKYCMEYLKFKKVKNLVYSVECGFVKTRV